VRLRHPPVPWVGDGAPASRHRGQALRRWSLHLCARCCRSWARRCDPSHAAPSPEEHSAEFQPVCFMEWHLEEPAGAAAVSAGVVPVRFTAGVLGARLCAAPRSARMSCQGRLSSSPAACVVIPKCRGACSGDSRWRHKLQEPDRAEW